MNTVAHLFIYNLFIFICLSLDSPYPFLIFLLSFLSVSYYKTLYKVEKMNPF